MGKFIDLTGQKFGRLTVIERAENRGKKPCWLCQCECGNVSVVRSCHLKSGAIVSCGCLQKEIMREKWQDEDFKKVQSERSRERIKEKWEDEEYRKMQSEKMKKQAKKLWEDEEYRKMRSEQSKEMWKDEDFKKMQSERSKEMWKDEDFKRLHSERMKEMWKDEEMKWKMHYKGGITPISKYLRELNVEWFNDCKEQAHYTCQLTGQVGGQLHTHHLKAFSTIVLEAHYLHNIKVKTLVKDYTKEELKLLEEYVTSWHKNNSNAVVLSDDVHRLFHSLYGQGNNTPEQFEEFKERYLAGEFKEILK